MPLNYGTGFFGKIRIRSHHSFLLWKRHGGFCRVSFSVENVIAAAVTFSEVLCVVTRHPIQFLRSDRPFLKKMSERARERGGSRGMERTRRRLEPSLTSE